MITILISIYCIFFAYLAWRRFDWALVLLFTLLPTYLIRFNIGMMPTTLLEVMIWIVAMVWLINIIANLHKNILVTFKNHRSLAIATILFIFGATISIFTSTDLRAALGEWKAFYIEPVLIFIILINTLSAKGSHRIREITRSGDFGYAQNDAMKLIDKILFGLIITGLAISILSVYQHFTGWMVPYSFWENRNTYRVTAWYGFPNGVGLFLAPLIPIALYLITKYWKITKNNNQKLVISNLPRPSIARMGEGGPFVISILFVPLSILAIIYAKSTGALVGIVSGIGVLLLCFKKTRWPALIFGLVTILTVYFLPTNNSIRAELLAGDRSGQLRVNMWAETSAYLLQNPIKGGGLANYAKIIYPYRIDKTIEVFHHPHNLLLTIWVNTGLIGLIGFVWVIVWFYRVGISMVTDKNNRIAPFLLSAMAIFLTTGLVDSPYIKNDMAILFWLLPALLLTTTAYEKMENSKAQKADKNFDCN